MRKPHKKVVYSYTMVGVSGVSSWYGASSVKEARQQIKEYFDLRRLKGFAIWRKPPQIRRG